ncbi:MAG TPA: hypothetical protein VFQ70_00930 [Candidatus Saccharimonadaceae bacterium]|nr:hypothetical protein [Candidatus Saccharimonadaceae bacterium]
MNKVARRPTSSGVAVEAIRTKGDTLDADPRRRRRVISLGRIAAVSAGIFPFFATGSYPSYPQNYIMPVTTVLALGAAMRAGQGIMARRRVNRAEEMQASVRRELDEPLDIVKVGPRHKESVVMRWYGLDGNAIEVSASSGLRERTRKVAEFARLNEIHSIAIGVGEDDETADLGGEFVSNRKRLKWVDLDDLASDERVRTLSPQELEEYVYEKLDARDDTLLQRLIQKIDDGHLSELFEEYLGAHDEQALAKIKRRARYAIERSAGSSGFLRDYSSGGVPIRQRVDVSAQVQSGNIHRTAVSPPVDATRAPSSRYLEIIPVARLVGFSSYEEVKQALETPEFIADMTADKAWAALYSVIHARDLEAKQQSEARDNSDEIAEEMTLFERLAASVNRRDVADVDVYKKRRLERMLAVVGLTLLPASVVGGGTGVAFFAASNAATTKLNAECVKYFHDKSYSILDDCYPGLQSEKFEEFSRHVHGLQEHYNKTVNTINNALLGYESTLPTDALQFMINHSGIDSLSGTLTSQQIQQLSGQLEITHGASPDMYTKDRSNSLIGDVPGKDNKIVYTVKSLNGLPVAGYWPTQHFNQVDATTSTSGVFIGGSADFLYSEPLRKVDTSPPAFYQPPSKLSNIMKQHPDFMVETPYIGYKMDQFGVTIGTTALPVKTGFRIVGARYVDKNNPSDSIPAVVGEANGDALTAQPSNTNGNSFFLGTVQNPVLQYWIKKTNVIARPKYSIGAETPNGEQLSKKSMQNIAQTVRRDLGLSALATPAQVFSSVHDDHTYAYSPFQRQHIAPVSLARKDSTQVLEAVGGVLADLKSYNCNIASAEYILATLDDPSHRALETGFHNLGHDNFLTMQDAHAWINTDDGILDPTPSKLAPGVKLRTKVEKTPDPKISKEWTFLDLVDKRNIALAIGAAGLLVMLKKRRNLIARAERILVGAGLSSKVAQNTINRRIHALYAPPGSSYRKRDEKLSAHDTAQRYVNNIPKEIPSTRWGKAIDARIRNYDD